MLLRLGLLCLLIGLSSAGSPLARETPGHSKSIAADFLLPNNITVQLYTIEVEPDFITDTFNGSVSIRFTNRILTDNITLHIDTININVNTINLLNANGTSNNTVIATISSNDTRQFFTVIFAENLTINETYTLVIGAFEGVLHLDNFGLYLARYTNEDGEIIKLASTQFQPTFARRAFPSFDEPALKAQFDISIVRSDAYHSLSNGALINTTEISPGRYRDDFARTAVMSSYLIAIVVSDFTYVSRGIDRIFGRPVAIADGRGTYALDVSPGILQTCSDFVGVNYTWGRMDQVGMADDYFAAGAMENWALVIYREYLLLYIDNVTTSAFQERIATIIAHEFGHMWFGNLVTLQWWTYIWLNEGFATYFEFYGPSIVQEDMDLMDQIVTKSVQFSLDRDDIINIRPLNFEVGSPDDIWSIFDVVAYDKAGAVIRMVEGILTTPVFRRGLNVYLNRFEYGNVLPPDLYGAWQTALNESNLQILPVNETIQSILSTWDSNPGFPLLTVTRNYITGHVTISQRRLIATDPNNELDNLWSVPISYATSIYNSNFNDTSPTLWLTTRSLTAPLVGLNADDWLVVNIQEQNYYRVNYDIQNWYRIIGLLNTDNFGGVHKLNRAQLLHDIFYFARFGIIDYQVALDLSQYVEREVEYVPLYPFITTLGFLNTYLANTAAYGNYQNYILRLLNASLTDVGYVESAWDRHVTKLNRIDVLTWVCRYNGGNCRDVALQQLRAWSNNSNAFIVPNLQTVLTCAALTIGNQDDWNFAYQQYLTASESVISARLISSLGCSQDSQILNGFLNLLVNVSSSFPAGDRTTAWASVYNSGNFGRDFAFNYTRQNFAAVATSLTQTQLATVLNGIAARFSTEAQVAEVVSLAESTGQQNVFYSAINTAQSNVVWANENLGSILGWFGESR